MNSYDSESELLSTISVLEGDNVARAYLSIDGPRGRTQRGVYRGPYASTVQEVLVSLIVDQGGGYDWNATNRAADEHAARLSAQLPDHRQPLETLLGNLAEKHGGAAHAIGGRMNNDCLSFVYAFPDGHAVWLQGHRDACCVVSEGPAESAPSAAVLAAMAIVPG